MTEYGEAVHINYTVKAHVIAGKDVFESPIVDYSIILLDGDKLYIGYGFGRSPEHRPTKLKEVFWTKQQ